MGFGMYTSWGSPYTWSWIKLITVYSDREYGHSISKLPPDLHNIARSISSYLGDRITLITTKKKLNGVPAAMSELHLSRYTPTQFKDNCGGGFGFCFPPFHKTTYIAEQCWIMRDFEHTMGPKATGNLYSWKREIDDATEWLLGKLK